MAGSSRLDMIGIAIALVAIALSLGSYLALNNRIDDVSMKINDLDRRVEDLSTEVSNLKENLAKLEERLNTINNNIDDLRKQLKALSEETDEKINMLEEKLSLKINQLQVGITEFKGEVLSTINKLNTTFTVFKREILGKVEALETTVSLLQAKINEQGADIQSIKNIVSALQDQVSSLQNDLDNLKSVVNELENTVSTFQNEYMFWSMFADERYKAELQHWLGEFKNLKEVLHPYYAEGEEYRLGNRMLMVMEFIGENFMYQYDNYVSILTSSGAIRVDEVLQAPNETYYRLGGDCEDLSVYAWASLATTKKPGEEVYLIFLYTTSYGHAAVLGLDKKEYQAYILDSVFPWMNGAAYLLKMRIENKYYGVVSTYWFYPTMINPLLRSILVDYYLASHTYYDTYTGEEMKYSGYYLWSPSKLVYEWLYFLETDSSDVEKIIIVNENEYHVFNSVDEFVSWLNSRL